MFNKNKLSAAIVALVAGGSNYAMAQENPIVEEVIVTGIRASAQASMDVKRDSAGVVDAISAEDIGKFPDSNLAESLQRITGVSIDRKNGEGFQITARGFGPQYNLITLNGRSLPSAQLLPRGGLVSNRSFDMSNIASEGVSGVEVYKTAKANVSSGGIGATVNLKTRRPLDGAEGWTGSFGGKALHDTTNRVGDDITPELSSYLSWANEKFGASVSATYQNRDSAQSGVFTNNWNDYSGPYSGPQFFEGINVDNPDTPIDEDNTDIITVENAPALGTQANTTPGIRYHHGDYERSRRNAQLTFQFAPTDRVTATLDHTYASQDYFVNSAEFSFWFGGGSFPVTNVLFDGNNDVATPRYLWSENPQGGVRDLGITQNQGNVRNELRDTGINIEFEVNDQLTLNFDAHTSRTSSLPGKGAVGNYFNVALGVQGVYAQGFDNSGDLPLLVGNFMDRYQYDHDNDPETDPIFGIRDGGRIPGQLDVEDLGSTVRQINHDRVWSDLDELNLSGSFDAGDVGTIDFGISRKSLESTQKSSFSQIELEGNWGVGTPGDAPAHLMQELDFAELFDGYRTSLTSEGRAWFNEAGNIDDPNVPGVQTTGSSAQVFTKGFIASDVAVLGQVLSQGANLPWAPAAADGTNRTIEEDINAIFVQYTGKFDVAEMELGVVAGLRYEETEVSSAARVAPNSFVWQGDNDFIANAGDAATAPLYTGEASYDNTLPNLDLSLNVTDDVVVRASYSKSIARASFNDLQEGMTNVQPPRGGATLLGGTPGDANNGNVGLLPLESKNIDLSVEWYFAETSYVSLGYFKKDVSNFIGTQVSVETVADVYDPSNGPRAQLARQELIARDAATPGVNPEYAVNLQNLFAMMASMNLVGSGCRNNPNAPAGAATCGADYEDFPYEQASGWENGVDLLAVTSGEYADPLSVNNVRRPVNSKDADLDGWEIAVQHFFGDTGFGIQANYTIVDGDVNYIITGSPTTTQFALTGLSDSANLALMYENYGVSARLAYNWRDKFLENPAFASNEPQFTEAYSQLDFNVSYELTDNFTVSFEGLNILEEDTRQYARTEQQLTRLEILGARYALGARYSF